MNPREMLLRVAGKCQTLEDLERLLCQMLSEISDVYADGSLGYGRKRVDIIGNLRIEIRIREHAPPHFHVIGPDCDASFRLDDCRCLGGTATSREIKIVQFWFQGAKNKLMDVWNEMRPLDCPVGRV